MQIKFILNNGDPNIMNGWVDSRKSVLEEKYLNAILALPLYQHICGQWKTRMTPE